MDVIRHSPAVLLSVTVCGLAAGGAARLTGAGGAADIAWLVTAAVGLGFAVWSAAVSLRRGRVGVDVIALLALAGAVAVGKLLAAAVISVMLASGRALESWAAERARERRAPLRPDRHQRRGRQHVRGDRPVGGGGGGFPAAVRAAR
jgi:cation transport ATPase